MNIALKQKPVGTDSEILPVDYVFNPSATTGLLLRQAVTETFANSFEHIFEASRGHLSIPSGAADLVARLRLGKRETPYLYAMHFKLVDAINEDRLDDAQKLMDEIVGLPVAQSGTLVTDFRKGIFPWDHQTIASNFSAEDDSNFFHDAPSKAAAAKRYPQVKQALDLLRETAPHLADEFEELITAIILVEPKPLRDAPPDAFGGCSALRAFGALILNVDTQPTVFETLISLVHEQGHTMLFAVSPNEGVVENSDDERYSSPLRADARPLEGIYHAMFVVARMIYCADMVRQSSKASDHDKERASIMIENAVPLFFDGRKTVREYARLTRQGKETLEACEDYMAAFA